MHILQNSTPHPHTKPRGSGIPASQQWRVPWRSGSGENVLLLMAVTTRRWGREAVGGMDEDMALISRHPVHADWRHRQRIVTLIHFLFSDNENKARSRKKSRTFCIVFVTKFTELLSHPSVPRWRSEPNTFSSVAEWTQPRLADTRKAEQHHVALFMLPWYLSPWRPLLFPIPLWE